MSHQQQTIDLINDLAVLLHSGQNIDAALTLLADANLDGALKHALYKIRDGVRAGQALSDQMREHPTWFNEFICGIVIAGEASGDLPATLDRLVEQLERDLLLKSKIVNALIYPAVLWLVMSISLVIVIAIVLPQLTAVIESLNAPRSTLTSVLISFGTFINNWGRVLGAILIGLTCGLWLLREELDLKLKLSKVLLKILPLDALLAKMEFARFSGVLSSLLKSGLPQVGALQIAAHSLQRAESQAALQKVIERVREGQSFGNSLSQFTALGSVYAHSIKAGEEGGQLAPTLDRLSRRLENEFTLSSQRLAAIVEPILVVLMGLIIGLVVYAIFAALQSVGEVPL